MKPPGLRSDSSPSFSNFSAVVEIAGLKFWVLREGKHINLHVLSTDCDEHCSGECVSWWTAEPLDQVIPKLEFLLGAARIAQGGGAPSGNT